MGYELVSKKGYVPKFNSKFKMKQLIEQSDKNSSQEYDRIFKERTKKGPNWQDVRRWKMLFKYYQEGNVVDIGCLDSQIADLALSFYYKKGLPVSYLGTDIAEGAIKAMKQKYSYGDSMGKPLMVFMVDNIYNTNLRENIAHYVILGEVLEHMESPQKVIEKAWKILSQNGILAISVPLEEEKEFGAVDGERHLWSFNEDDIISMIPGKAEIKTKILRSKWFPKYKYCWPQLIMWIKKL